MDIWYFDCKQLKRRNTRVLVLLLSLSQHPVHSVQVVTLQSTKWNNALVILLVTKRIKLTIVLILTDTHWYSLLLNMYCNYIIYLPGLRVFYLFLVLQLVSRLMFLFRICILPIMPVNSFQRIYNSSWTFYSKVHFKNLGTSCMSPNKFFQ